MNSAVFVYTSQNHPQVVEVDLDPGLGRRRMGLRHVAGLQRPTRLGCDLRAAFGHVITHRRIRQLARAVLVHQPRQHPARRVTLLLQGVQIGAKHVIDRRQERLQPR